LSRWIEEFENHPFREEWQAILSSLDELTIDDETIATSVEELARFKKK